jgi:hypothetical protein
MMILSIMIFVILLAGCAKDSSENDGDSKDIQQEEQTKKKGNNSKVIIEAKDLISKEEAEELLGEPVNAAELSEQEVVGLKLCFYNATDEDSTKYLQVGLTQLAFMPDNGNTPLSIYTTLKENLTGVTFVEGIGDEAFLAPPGLHIISGDYYITVAVGDSNDIAGKEILTAAGLKVVENLN